MTLWLVTIIISCISLVVAVLAFGRTVVSARRSLLAQLQMSFIAPEASSARSSLHAAFSTYGPEWYVQVDATERVRINSALAHLDSLAFQVMRRHISRSDAILLWGVSARLCRDHAVGYIADRRELAPVWLWLDAFCELSEAHRPHGWWWRRGLSIAP